MILFVLTLLALLAAAAGIAVGALRGRPLCGGPCALRSPAACLACTSHHAVRRDATGGGC